MLVAVRAGDVGDMELNTVGLSDLAHCQIAPAFRRVEHADGVRIGHRLQEQFEPLRVEFRGEEIHTSDVAARVREALDDPGFGHTFPAKGHDNRNRGRRLPRCQNR